MSTTSRPQSDDERPPIVTIVVPCRDQEALLPETVASIALQTFVDWEIIVVDDGGSGDASKVVHGLARRLPGRLIRVLEQPRRGLSPACNMGARCASGKYVLPLEAGDLLEETFLAKTVAALEGEASAAFAFTDVLCFGAEKTERRTGPFTAEALASGGVTWCTALYRRDAWRAIGGYDETLEHGYEDLSFWISAVERGYTAVHVEEPLLFHRTRAASSTAREVDGSHRARAEVAARHPRFFATSQLQGPRVILGNGRGGSPTSAQCGHVPITPGRRPEISLIFASYNHETYISQAITSLACQTVPYDRVVFFSDGSKDRTLAIARERLAGIPNVQFLDALETNRGLTARLREAAARIPGGYISTLSGDDLLSPSACETFRRAIERNPVDWYVGGTVYVHDDLEPFHRIDPAAEMTARPGQRLLDLLLLQEPWFPAHGWCYTLDLLRRVGGYDTKFMIEDYVLAVRFARATHPVFLSEVIGIWRKHEGSMSHTRGERMNLDVASAASEFLADAPIAASREIVTALSRAACEARALGAEERAERYEAASREIAVYAERRP